MGKISKELQVGKAGEYLAMADLLLNDRQAFLTDQGLPYDLVFELGDRLIKIQVKSTRSLKILNRGYKNKVYSFHVRRAGKNGSRVYDSNEFDGYALVTLDTRSVYYVPFTERINRTWLFRDKNTQYKTTNQKTAPYIQDFTLERFLNEI